MKVFRRLLNMIVACGLGAVALAQTPFSKTTLDQYSFSIEAAADGGCYASGYDMLDTRAAVVRLDASGAVLWANEMPGTGLVLAMRELGSGDLLVAVTTENVNGNTNGMRFMLVNPAGVQLSCDSPAGMIGTQYADALFSGPYGGASLFSVVVDNSTLHVLAFDPNGQVLWDMEKPALNGTTATLLPDGGMMVSTFWSNTLARFDDQGQGLWQQQYNFPQQAGMPAMQSMSGVRPGPEQLAMMCRAVSPDGDLVPGICLLDTNGVFYRVSCLIPDSALGNFLPKIELGFHHDEWEMVFGYDFAVRTHIARIDTQLTTLYVVRTEDQCFLTGATWSADDRLVVVASIWDDLVGDWVGLVSTSDTSLHMACFDHPVGFTLLEGLLPVGAVEPTVAFQASSISMLVAPLPMLPFAPVFTDRCSLTTDVVHHARPATLHMFPDPADGEAVLQCDQAIEHLIVTDLFGRRVISLRPNSGLVRLNTSGWSSGVYVVRVDGGPCKKFSVSH